MTAGRWGGYRDSAPVTLSSWGWGQGWWELGGGFDLEEMSKVGGPHNGFWVCALQWDKLDWIIPAEV